MSLQHLLSPLLDLPLLFGSFLLVLVQAVLALPWLFALDPRGMKKAFTTRNGLLWTGGFVLGATLLLDLYVGNNPASGGMIWRGRVYGILLHLQLLADVFIVGLPWALARVFPKVGAVAQAAYKESWRQPTFWLILIAGLAATWLAVVVPYFTFGDDYKMMKQIGFDIVMLAPLLFGVLAASISVSEEIEGRTAVTVMSKPINRRSFLLGKFLGVLMACAAMSLLLAANLNGALLANPAFDPINLDRAQAAEAMSQQAKDVIEPAAVNAVPGGAGMNEFTRGAARWMSEVYTHSFGVLLGFGQVMILVAIATALATRLHFVVSLISVLAVYLFGHLAPVVAQVSRGGGKGTGAALVGFLAQVFDVVLPALEYFNLGPAIIRDTPLDLAAFAGYSLTVFGYSVIYTAIVLVVGLLLFEDRDLG